MDGQQIKRLQRQLRERRRHLEEVVKVDSGVGRLGLSVSLSAGWQRDPGVSLNLSAPQFLHSWNGGYNNSHLVGLLRGPSGPTHVWQLVSIQ